MDVEKFSCKICTNLLCRPISCPCGHNFCLLCIKEITHKSIYHPRCPVCNQRIVGKFEINKLIESVISKNWQNQYKIRLQDPGFRKELNIYALWMMSICKTVRALTTVLLPVGIFIILYRHANNFPRIILYLIRVFLKLGTYRSTSFIWQILWALMHMFVKYIEATSVLSNITN